MSNPADIRAALAQFISDGPGSVPGLGGSWSVHSRWRVKPEPPQIDMMLGPINYDLAMRAGNEDVSFIVRATVQPGEDSNQDALDPLVDWSGSGSLKAVLEADKTLGGAVSSLRVMAVSEMKQYPTEGGWIPGVEFTVEVTPNG